MLFSYQQADRRSAGQPPKSANELQFGFDIVDQKRHVPVQVELGHFKYERIAQNRHAAHPIHLEKRDENWWEN